MSTINETITIHGKSYNIINDGIDKVVKDDEVAVIIASDGCRYWTSDNRVVKDINMLFHPELIKIVMEDMCEDENFTLEWIEENLKLNTKGFENADIMNLSVIWVEVGSRFNIAFDYINDNNLMTEYVQHIPKNFIKT